MSGKESTAALVRPLSDETLRRVFDSLPTGAYTCDAAGLITYFNQRAVEIWGRAPRLLHHSDRFCGSFKNFYPDGRPLAHEDCFMAVALREGRRFDGVEGIIERPGGERRSVLAHVNPLRDAAGAVTGAVNVLVDVTDQKQVQELLIASERRHRQLVENLGDGVWAADRNALTTFVNPRITEMLGYRPEEMIGRRIVEFMSPEFARLVQERQERRQRGVTDRGEFEFIKRDGRRLLASVTAYPLMDEQGQFAGSVAVISDVTDRKRAEQELRDSEARLNSVWQNSVDGMRLNDADGRIVAVNPAYCRLVGMPCEELEGQLFTMVYKGPQAAPDALHRFCERFKARTIQPREARTAHFHKGHSAVVEVSSSFVEVPGRPPLLLSIFRDVTERKRAEELLHHSQKMDAIGKLAGGIAHDFNNLLLVILGYAEVMLQATPEVHPQRESLVAITEAAERAASLTRQLLAFSRRTMLEPKVLDLNVVVRETERLLDRLIGEDIQLRSVLASDLARVKADPGQLSQIILNLAVNARDAMPQGGQLSIETKNVVLDTAAAGENSGVLPGSFVLLAISDSGVGMPAEVQRHIFEPFFTTKEVGSGTGLGLAVVHGIVKQSGGHIDFSSQVGAGTTFRIYFPAVDDGNRAVTRRLSPNERRGSETVLLVEDEDGVRALALEVLRANGYRVLEACHGLEALRIAECHTGPIDLLLTDVVMPKMDGRDLAEVLRRRFPNMRIMFMSGYTDDAVLRRGLSSETVAFLPKPYTPAALAEKVRQALDRA